MNGVNFISLSFSLSVTNFFALALRLYVHTMSFLPEYGFVRAALVCGVGECASRQLRRLRRVNNNNKCIISIAPISLNVQAQRRKKQNHSASHTRGQAKVVIGA